MSTWGVVTSGVPAEADNVEDIVQPYQQIVCNNKECRHIFVNPPATFKDRVLIAPPPYCPNTMCHNYRTGENRETWK